MKISHTTYVPCLRWKQGEYQAVMRLSPSSKTQLLPLIEVPEIGYDFETGSEVKDIDEHLEPFARRVFLKWGKRPCFVDLIHIDPGERLANGHHPLRHVFAQLRSMGCLCIPVTSMGRDSAFQNEVARIARQDGNGVCFRVPLDHVEDPSFPSFIEDFDKGRVEISKCDIVLDLGSPNFTPIPAFTKLVTAILSSINSFGNWRTVTVLGTAFPANMGGIKEGVEMIPRNEWLLYKSLVSELKKTKSRIPIFGDYAINHPETSTLDMRFVKPAATIRYATDEHWLLVKGKNVRDYGFSQYQNHCQSVADSDYFEGTTFSFADKYIEDCSQGLSSTGNLTTWRWIGTNHHIEKVVSDLANFFAL